MYAQLIEVRRLLNPKYPGTLASSINIGSPTPAACSAASGSQFANDAGSFIDGMLYHRYNTPFGSPTPGDIRWIANRLAASYVIQAVKRYTADSASNFLYDKQQELYQMAMVKLQALADGVEVIRGQQIAGAPLGEFTKSDDREFEIPGSGNVRPSEGL